MVNELNLLFALKTAFQPYSNVRLMQQLLGEIEVLHCVLELCLEGDVVCFT